MWEVVSESGDTVGESPLWSAEEGAVYWTDVNRGLVHRHHMATGSGQSWSFGEPAAGIRPTHDPAVFLLVLGSRLILWEPKEDRRRDLVRPDLPWPLRRLNDSAVDPAGGLFVGSMPNNVAPDGSHRETQGATGVLFRMHGDEITVKKTRGFACPNSLAFGPAGRMYLADTPRNIIETCDFDPVTGQIGPRRAFATFDRGLPDGSAIDAEGCLWNARFFGGCVVRFTPDGGLDRVLDLPVSNPACCGFGGDDGRTLFVTTARLMAPEDERLAGALFATRVDVAGAPDRMFAHGLAKAAS